MIVCLCMGISDRKVKEMAREGQTLKEIVKSCEASTCCGACAVDLRDLVRSETEKPRPQATRNNDC